MNVHFLDRDRIHADMNFVLDGAEDHLIAGDAAFLQATYGASL
jgi:hypothetical protein